MLIGLTVVVTAPGLLWGRLIFPGQIVLGTTLATRNPRGSGQHNAVRWRGFRFNKLPTHERPAHKHTHPSFHGVVLALAIIVVVCGMIEFVRFLFASTIALDQMAATVGRKSQTIGRLQHSPHVKSL